MKEPENTGPQQGSRSPKGTFLPGQSGNPSGRPKGARNRASLVAQQLLDGDTEELMRKLIVCAKKGKPWALRLVVDRIVPARRSTAVEIELPRMERAADIALGVQAVIDAAAAGEITLAEAREFCALLEQQRKALETSELEVRIEALERGEKS